MLVAVALAACDGEAPPTIEQRMARLTDAETSDDATQAIWKELAEAGAERSVESALNLLESESPAERQAGMITIVAFAIR